MGQTPSNSSHVDYTFGLIATKSSSNSNSKSYCDSDKDEQDYPASTQCGTFKNQRLLLYPQHYGLEDESMGDDNDREHVSSSSHSNVYQQQQQQQQFCFRTPQTQHAKQLIERVDSGYAADQDAFVPKKATGSTTIAPRSNRLTLDILYVDQMYYNGSVISEEEQQQQQQQQCHSTTIHTTDSSGIRDQQDDMLSIGTKLTFAGAALASKDTSMREVCLSRRSLIDLNPNIGLLTSLRKLDLSNNQLIDLPDSIGQLKQLEVLCISQNRLQHLPESLQCLSRLTELDLSYNQLQHIPSLGHFSVLCTLLLSHNQLTSIPSDLAGMKQLVTLDLSHNPLLSVLPAEVTHLSKLRRLKLDQCHQLLNPTEHQNMEVNLSHDPPSLMEICARKIILSLSSTVNSSKKSKQQNSLVSYLRPPPSSSSSSSSSPQGAITTKRLTSHLTGHLLSYLASANICSSCHGPFYESHVIRHRLIEKNDMWIPLEYRLCSAHWSDETDRLLNMFHSETSSITQTNTSNRITTTLATLHSLASQQDVDQEQEQLCMDMDLKIEIPGTTPAAGKVTFLRHPQRLQRVMNKNPSTFLIQKIHFG